MQKKSRPKIEIKNITVQSRKISFDRNSSLSVAIEPGRVSKITACKLRVSVETIGHGSTGFDSNLRSFRSIICEINQPAVIATLWSEHCRHSRVIDRTVVTRNRIYALLRTTSDVQPRLMRSSSLRLISSFTGDLDRSIRLIRYNVGGLSNDD